MQTIQQSATPELNEKYFGATPGSRWYLGAYIHNRHPIPTDGRFSSHCRCHWRIRHLGLRLLPQLSDFEVIGVDMQRPKTTLPLRFVQMDLGQEEICRELFLLLRESGASAVIHLAFVVTRCARSAGS